MRNALLAGKAAHAYLISGPEGIGKAGVALEMARLMLCDHQGATSCGVCAQCKTSATLQHPDLHIYVPTPTPEDKQRDAPGNEAFPEQFTAMIAQLRESPYADVDLAGYRKSESKSRRASTTASKIRIADSRNLIREASRRPYQAQRSVFLLLDAHLMNREAQNSLLKLLEEPPSSAHVLLTASSLQLLLPTVRSRCQRVPLSAYSREEIHQALLQAGIETPVAELSAGLAGGSVKRALFFASMDTETLEKAAVDFLALSAQLIPDKVHAEVERLLDDPILRDDAFFELLMLFLSDAAHHRGSGTSRLSHFPSQSARISKLVQAYPSADFTTAAKAVDTAAGRRALGYTPSLVLTAMVIELHRALGPRLRA
jgi:DNA polymerase-3 subunit delta'